MKKADIQEAINKLEDLRDKAHGESSYQEYLENWKDCNYHYGRYKGLERITWKKGEQIIWKHIKN